MSVWNQFRGYIGSVDLTRVRLSSVPVELQEAVREYRAALSAQLADPENESWDSLGPNERHNALLAVKLKFDTSLTERVLGNCPRCGGLGFIAAYRHVRGGQCLACKGTGGVRQVTKPE